MLLAIATACRPLPLTACRAWAPAIMSTDDADAPFDMSVLQRRIQEVEAKPAAKDARLFVLDSMVPGQRLLIDEAPLTFIDTLKAAEDAGTPLVMVGRQRLKLLSHGVEVSVTELEEATGRVTLMAGSDLVEIVDDGEDEGSLWLGRAGSARWVSLDATTPEEQSSAAIEELLEELESLTVDWIKLVRSTGRERVPQQLETVMADLGPCPDFSLPSRRALWVAGLINPLPALGVALEIRPAALMAPTALVRVQVAIMGVKDSLQRIRSPGPAF